jgi:hypothetical protein
LPIQYQLLQFDAEQLRQPGEVADRRIRTAVLDPQQPPSRSLDLVGGLLLTQAGLEARLTDAQPERPITGTASTVATSLTRGSFLLAHTSIARHCDVMQRGGMSCGPPSQ